MQLEKHPRSPKKTILTIETCDEESLLRASIPQGFFNPAGYILGRKFYGTSIQGERTAIQLFGMCSAGVVAIPATFPNKITLRDQHLLAMHERLQERHDLDRGYTIHDLNNQRPMAYLRQEMIAYMGSYFMNQMLEVQRT